MNIDESMCQVICGRGMVRAVGLGSGLGGSIRRYVGSGRGRVRWSVGLGSGFLGSIR